MYVLFYIDKSALKMVNPSNGMRQKVIFYLKGSIQRTPVSNHLSKFFDGLLQHYMTDRNIIRIAAIAVNIQALEIQCKVNFIFFLKKYLFYLQGIVD